MSFGRVNGMYSWRVGWRADVLRRRNGDAIHPPPESPVDLEARVRIVARTRSEASLLACGDKNVNTSVQSADETDSHAAAAWEWWQKTLGSPRFIAAPMIGQSDPAFRRLVMRYGSVGLCYSPMYLATEINSGMHDHNFDPNSCQSSYDRPLFIQLAGSDPVAMVAAALRVQQCCDGIDVNFGCPQSCAEDGGYGAPFLESNPAGAVAIVTALQNALDVPISIKMRLQPSKLLLPDRNNGDIETNGATVSETLGATAAWEASVGATIRVGRQLVAAGASLVCLHGRYRTQRDHQGPADWRAVREVAAALSVPVISNGSIASLEQAERCLAFTGCAAVMSGTALLRHPTLFAPPLSGSSTVEGIHEPSDKSLALSQSDGGVPCVPLSSALWNCRAYLASARECWSETDARLQNTSTSLLSENQERKLATCAESASSCPRSDFPCVNGRPRAEVCRDHLLAMLQAFLMDTEHLDLWSLLSAKSVTSLDQFAATLNLVEHRLTGEVYKGLPILTLSQIKRNELDGKAIELGVTEHQDAGDY